MMPAVERRIPTVRHALATDIDALMRLGERFLATEPYRDLIQGNRFTLERTAEAFVRDADKLALVAEADDGSAVGMLLALAFAHPFSGDLAVSELVWWVDPEHRGGVGLRLYQALERWAVVLGARRLLMVAPSLEIERLYHRLGYVPVERTYQKELAS